MYKIDDSPQSTITEKFLPNDIKYRVIFIFKQLLILIKLLNQNAYLWAIHHFGE